MKSVEETTARCVASVLKGALFHFVGSFDIQKTKLVAKNSKQFCHAFLFINVACNVGRFRSILLVLF